DKGGASSTPRPAWRPPQGRTEGGSAAPRRFHEGGRREGAGGESRFRGRPGPPRGEGRGPGPRSEFGDRRGPPRGEGRGPGPRGSGGESKFRGRPGPPRGEGGPSEHALSGEHRGRSGP